MFKFFWINLDRSIRRRQTFQKRLEQADGTEFCERVCAIDGTRPYQDKIKFSSNLNFSTDLEIACTLSHLEALKKGYNSALDYVFVAEDDLTFDFMNCSLKETLIKIIKTAPADWNIIQIGVTCVSEWLRTEIEIARNEGRDFIEKKQFQWGANCYVVSKTGAKILMDRHWKNDCQKWCFETVPQKVVSENVLYEIPNAYLYTRLPFGFEGLESEIHSNHLPSQNDTLKWLLSLHKHSVGSK